MKKRLNIIMAIMLTVLLTVGMVPLGSSVAFADETVRLTRLSGSDDSGTPATIEGDESVGYVIYPEGTTEIQVYWSGISDDNPLVDGESNQLNLEKVESGSDWYHLNLESMKSCAPDEGFDAFGFDTEVVTPFCYLLRTEDEEYYTLYIFVERSAPETVKDVTATLRTGNDGESVEIMLSCETEGASIYYTLDGSTPSASSTPYINGGKITIKETRTLKAIAIKDELQSKIFSELCTVKKLKGGGSSTDPYIIETIGDLKILAGDVSKGNTFKGKYFKMTEDIELPKDWIPIGNLKEGEDPSHLTYITQTNLFSGHFDGDGHTITVAKDGLPLFGSAVGGSISHLKVYGERIRGYGLVQYYAAVDKGGYNTAYLTIDDVTILKGSKILKSGLIGGYGNTSVDILNCTVQEGVVIGDDGTWGEVENPTWGYPYVGTLDYRDCVGSFVGAWNGNITNCISYATVYGRNNVGGIAGMKGQSMREFFVTDCAFYGEVKATGSMVGGIVGNGYTGGSAPNTPCVTIENCYATGKISGGNCVGGIFGGEGGSAENWNNGDGRIRNNYFSGTVSASEPEASVGGIIGYMKSLDTYNYINNNYYVKGCGANRGIGKVEKVIGKDGGSSSDYHFGRSDDPTGADAEKLTKEISKESLTNGTLLEFLNQDGFGRKDWTQGMSYPEFERSTTHIIGIASPAYLQEAGELTLWLGGDYGNVKLGTAIVKYSDGTKKEISTADGEFSGVDFSKEGYQIATFTYDNYSLPFGVRVAKDRRNTPKISVRVSVFGESGHENDTEDVHTYADGNLEEWVKQTVIEGYEDDTAFDFIKQACNSKAYTVNSSDGKNITALSHVDMLEEGGGKTTLLSNRANGAKGQWLYTVNGEYTNKPMGEQTLQNNDVVVLHWSDDPEKDYKNAKKVTPTPISDSEKTVKVTFRLIGAEAVPKGKTVDLKNYSSYLPNYVTWISTKSYQMPIGSKMYDLFVKATKDAGLNSEGAENDYVKTIKSPSGYWLGEFDNGKYSGWMYTVNGKHPNVGLLYYQLQDNDKVVWHYVNDYRYEVEDWFDEPDYPSLAKKYGITEYYNGWLKAPDRVGASGGKIEETKTVTTDTASGVAATTAPTETKVTEKTNADGTKEKTAVVTVSADNQTEIIKQATEKKSTEIVLEVAASDTNGAQNVQLQLNVSFVKNVSDKTDAALTVNTENGTVSLDQDTIKTVLSEAKGATITLDVNKVANPTGIQKKAAGESGQILSLTVKSAGKTISDFKAGKVTVTVAISTALQNKRVAAIHIAEDGKIEQMPGRSREVGGKKCYEFTTSHFSDFALVDADELGLETENEIDAPALVAKLTPVARSAKTAKGYIKVTTNLDKNDKAIIRQLKDAGYTVKYRFYRSTKKSAGYKSALTKQATSYTNTSGKKGTKYYYKVQVRVYDGSGRLAAKTALKQCKYASRKF